MREEFKSISIIINKIEARLLRDNNFFGKMVYILTKI